MSKNYAKSLMAHNRLYKKALYGPDTLKSNISLYYHSNCMFAMEQKLRCLSEKEKSYCLKDAKEHAHEIMNVRKKSR